MSSRMPKRTIDNAVYDVPPRKKISLSTSVQKKCEIFTDINGKQWKLGPVIGVGGFGEIYLASDDLTKEVKNDSRFVAKIENHKNGPLFVEINCYLRIAKPSMIEDWMERKKVNSLGVPYYVASGSHFCNDERFRFLILPRFDKDLEKILQAKKLLNIKTVLTIASQIIDILEYIHSKGYIHSDIKASNILLANQKSHSMINTSEIQVPITRSAVNNPMRACAVRKRNRNLRQTAPVSYVDDIPYLEEILFQHEHETFENRAVYNKKDQVYLLDYGLACKFITSTGEHKPSCVDQRKAHAGTILFCSRDAHQGITSRRSDLESLGYNLIYWLTGNLPWMNDDVPEIVERRKRKYLDNLEYFLSTCFVEYPKFLLDYFKYLKNLKYQEKPNYSYCKKLFEESIRAHGYEADSCFDFDNVQTTKKKQNKYQGKLDNMKIRKKCSEFPRSPLKSNIPVKPRLRGKEKNKKKVGLQWFEVDDPEIILKQGRERKNTENTETIFTTNITDLDIVSLNPTQAMLQVYNKCRERLEAEPPQSNKIDNTSLESPDDYSYSMLSLAHRVKKKKEPGFDKAPMNLAVLKSKKSVIPCITKQKRKTQVSSKLPHTRSTKAALGVKKDHVKSRKTKPSGRSSYSLRG